MKGIDIFMKQKIQENNDLFFILKKARGYIYYLLNKLSNYRLERKKFYNHLGYPLNLEKPSSFNEKIVWKKIYDRNPLLATTADKFAVRSYLKKVLGEKEANKILVPLLYVTDKPETIPFKELPSDFVIKPNHASGCYKIIKNGDYKTTEIVNICQKWLNVAYGLEKLEWAYQRIKRLIIIEKFLCEDDGKYPKRYNFYMFHGKCKSIHAISGDKRENPSVTYLDEKWNLVPAKNPFRPQVLDIMKPINHLSMMSLAEELSMPFDHVRVDLYNIYGHIYFGELTHYTASGMLKYEPQTYDFELGKYWKIKPKYWKKYFNFKGK